MTEKHEIRTLVIRILCIGLLMSFVSASYAQTWKSHHNAFEATDDYHFGYVSGSVGYSMLQTKIENAVPHGSVGGAVGLGYEFRNSGLWASFGIQMSFHRSSLTMDEYDTRNEKDQTPYTGIDTQKKPTIFHYHVKQTDEIQWNFIDLPVMVGYYIRGFHVGAGLKVSYAINPVTRSIGTYTVSATNTEYNVTFENMPDRGYTDYDFNTTERNHLTVGASVTGEIGYDLLSSIPTRSRICNVLKLSFYMEYGLNNHLLNRETPQLRTTPTPDNAAEAKISPYLNTFATPLRTVPFYTGVKLTYMIGGSRTARSGMHHGCMCYN